MTKSKITVSILICTHNRADDVQECINALKQRPLGEEFELILVDSGSTGGHAKQLADYAAADPRIRFCRLNEAGTSLARNTALRMATGEWVWWLDDDALPEPQWPGQIAACLAAADLKTAVIGGRVTPTYPPGSETRHLTPRWKVLISCMDAEEAGNVSDGYNVACANMLMRRVPVLEIGGFSENVGRVGAYDLVSGEENLVIQMLQDRGYKALFMPELRVTHKVAGNRLTFEWLARRAFAEGVSIATINKILKRKPPLSQNPLKLRVTTVVFSLLLAIRPNLPDAIIRMNLAKGILSAQG